MRPNWSLDDAHGELVDVVGEFVRRGDDLGVAEEALKVSSPGSTPTQIRTRVSGTHVQEHKYVGNEHREEEHTKELGDAATAWLLFAASDVLNLSGLLSTWIY